MSNAITEEYEYVHSIIIPYNGQNYKILICPLDDLDEEPEDEEARFNALLNDMFPTKRGIKIFDNFYNADDGQWQKRREWLKKKVRAVKKKDKKNR